MYLDQQDVQSQSGLGGLMAFMRQQGVQPGEAITPAEETPSLNYSAIGQTLAGKLQEAQQNKEKETAASIEHARRLGIASRQPQETLQTRAFSDFMRAYRSDR